MDDRQQREAAKQFSKYWKEKGYEKGESQSFWLSLLRDVYGVDHPEQFINFEEQVHLDHTSFIDGVIPATKVLIEQKSLEKDLRKPIRQSDGTLLTPFQQAKKYISIQFVTPTAFKQNGKYLNYPDIRSLYLNLMNKYDAVSEQESMRDEETLDQLVENTTISRYELRSTVFCLEGVRIPAFLGRLTLRLDGAQTMANFADVLLQFGTYSGIGIKTALGMGAIRLLEERSRSDE